MVSITNNSSVRSVLQNTAKQTTKIAVGMGNSVLINGGARASLVIKNNYQAQSPPGNRIVLKVGNAGLLTQNVSVVNKLEAETVTHSLATTKLDVTFYNTDGRKNTVIDWVAVDDNTIRLYLPQPDGLPSSFSGDIFFIRRA